MLLKSFYFRCWHQPIKMEEDRHEKIAEIEARLSLLPVDYKLVWRPAAKNRSDSRPHDRLKQHVTN